jgi:hypothetical protein
MAYCYQELELARKFMASVGFQPYCTYHVVSVGSGTQINPDSHIAFIFPPQDLCDGTQIESIVNPRLLGSPTQI